jgi:transposase-like protein
MAESTKQDVQQASAERFVRRGEAFWREVFTQWEASGVGVRAFCQQRGIAVSTFGLWRSKLSHRTHGSEAASGTMTADTAVFITAQAADPLVAMTAAPATSDSVSAGAPNDGVTLVLAGVRIELSGTHAVRIVDFVLGQLGDGRC